MSARVIRDIHSTLLGYAAFAAARLAGMSVRGKGLGFGLGEGPIGEPTEEEWGERYGQGEGSIVEPEEDEWE